MKTGSLSEQIDKVVREHLAQVRAEASAALERAFERPKTTSPRKKRAPGKHRDRAEVAELAERLHKRIMAEPGEPMARHAEQLGTSARELHRPMSLLRQAGRLRTTGARNQTRYYPATGS